MGSPFRPPVPKPEPLYFMVRTPQGLTLRVWPEPESVAYGFWATMGSQQVGMVQEALHHCLEDVWGTLTEMMPLQ